MTSKDDFQSNDKSENRCIKQQRIAALDEVEALLKDLEEQFGSRPHRVEQNLHIARDNLLDDGEYNYCVRLALVQLDRVAAQINGDPTELREEISALQDQLSEKAALPPQDQITR